MCVLWHRPCKGRAVEAIVDGAVDKIVICGERPGDQEVTKIANCCALCTPTRVRSSMICISISALRLAPFSRGLTRQRSYPNSKGRRLADIYITMGTS